MFELFWAIWVIPKFIYPIAKANGKSGIRWVFFTILIFLITEISIVGSYLYVYQNISSSYKLPENAEYFWMTYLVYVVALITGFLSVELVKRFLSKKDKMYKSI